MTYPWDILNISAKNADVGAVKRAYAKQLKKCRPDDDPEGFQIVLKARDQALWLLKNLDIITAHQHKTGEGNAVGQCNQNYEPKQKVEGEGGLRTEDYPAQKAVSGSKQELEQGQGLAGEDLSHSYFEKELEKMKAAPIEAWDLLSWKAFLNQLNQAHLSCRQDIEWLVIDYIGQRVLRQQNILVKPAEKDKVLAVLLLLNEAFGWDGDDKKVYHILGNSNADFILGLIRSELFNKKASLLSQARNKSFIPYIAIPDLRAYMGGEGEDIIHDYLWAWRKKQWQHSFNWSGFLLGYIWQAWRSFWLVGLAILSLQFLILTVLMGDRAMSLLFQMLIVMALIAAPLLMIARYGNYWVIQAAYKVIKKAEKKSFNSAMERYDFLQKAGRGNLSFVFLLISMPVISGIFLSYFVVF